MIVLTSKLLKEPVVYDVVAAFFVHDVSYYHLRCIRCDTLCAGASGFKFQEVAETGTYSGRKVKP
jgi:hypothetical protein